MRKITVIFTCLLSLIVAKAQTSQNTSYEEQGYIPWFEVNYAQIAYENNVNNSNCEIETNTRNYTIGKANTQTYVWKMKTGNQEILLDENIITTNSNGTLDFYCSNKDMGVSFSAAHRIGILCLKKDDIIEIAIRKNSSTANNVESVIDNNNIYNISTRTLTSAGIYNFEGELNSELFSIPYNVYTMNVQSDGPILFCFNQRTQVAYIKIYRLTSSVTPYYLVGDMTKNEVNDWVTNPSYEFKTSNGGLTYNLSVGSILKDQKFQIVNFDMSEWYGIFGPNYNNVNYDGVPFQLNFYEDKQGTDPYDMTFDTEVVNALFTLTPIIMPGDIPSLTIKGTPVNTGSMVISPGNDQTMQSGEVNEDYIYLITVSEGALVYIYVSKEYEELYYTVDHKNPSQEIKSRTGANRVKANINDGYFTIGLKLGSGTINVYNGADAEEPEKTFTYTVTHGVPTGINVETGEKAEAVYFNLQGVKITNPERGNLYIKVLNGKASKVIL